MSFRKQSMSDEFQIDCRAFCDDTSNDNKKYYMTVNTGICNERDIDTSKKKPNCH